MTLVIEADRGKSSDESVALSEETAVNLTEQTADGERAQVGGTANVDRVAVETTVVNGEERSCEVFGVGFYDTSLDQVGGVDVATQREETGGGVGTAEGVRELVVDAQTSAELAVGNGDC